MVGQNIGKYRVLERIGRGGMGTVYRALDETLHRDVAIKVLNAELNDPEVARRFRAEAITVARLSHPGIATIYELFQSDGQWLMVMEFVRGETLEHMVERLGPQTPQRTAELAMQALAALAHAHSMGVVHRDLKPANIMITEGGAIKIMDFGIARVAGTEHLTNAGFMMGTPAYMAPEQVMGQEIDARADLYAMGVVFYRLTTARLPFKGDTPFAMAQSQVNDPPTPIHLVRTDLPPWVEELTTRALAKNPDERFQSAIDFHESLARCLAGLPLLPPGYSASAPTELLMTPPRAMPTGSIRSSLPPLTGAPPLSGTQPVMPPPAKPMPASPPAASASTAPASSDEFDASAPTMLSPSPSGRLAVPGPPSGPVMGQPSASVSMPSAAPVSDSRDGAPALVSAAVHTPAATASGAPLVAASTAAQRPRAGAPAVTDRAAVPPAKKGNGAVIGIAAAVVLVAAAGAFWFSSRRSPAPVEQPAGATAANNTQAASETPVEPTASAPPESASETPVETAPAASAPASTQAPDSAAPASPSTPRGTAATRGSAPATARGAAAPEPVVEDTPLSFKDARVMVLKGRKADDQEVTLWFANGYINAIAAKGQASLGAMPYKAVAGATYLRARDPKWNAELASPPENLDVGGMLRTDKNWLVVQSREAFLILRLDDANVRTVLQTLTEKTGVTIDYPKK